ncbi:MAG: hypothetical protein J5757_07550 [Lachnospiraceae bacterium]|nr:hypothetical protein [Lachnospiraceae bacterium]
MELLIIIAMGLIVLFMLGYTLWPLVSGVLFLAFMFAIVCELFFVISGILWLLARRRNAKYLGLSDDDGPANFAYYEIDGEEYRNIFPTDAFMRRFLYRKEEVNVRLWKRKKKSYVFDRVTTLVIGLGLISFSVIIVLLSAFVR